MASKPRNSRATPKSMAASCTRLVGVISFTVALLSTVAAFPDAIESRIEKADVPELSEILSEIKTLPASRLSSAQRMSYLTMIGDRFAELSSFESAENAYRQAISLPVTGNREQEDGCASEWSSALAWTRQDLRVLRMRLLPPASMKRLP